MIIERLLALLLLFLLAPILIIVGIVLKISMGSPVFFKQNRPGKGGKIFLMIKFRTMLNEDNSIGVTEEDESRITKLGNFLRSSSLDEIPTLWNVLRGEMSFVGPRPLLEEYLPLYNDRQSQRHSVRPGITGWAQINGRNLISWEKKLELDVWYVENRSFWLDIKILWKTIYRVFKREGISQDGHATMPLFVGDKRINRDE